MIAGVGAWLAERAIGINVSRLVPYAIGALAAFAALAFAFHLGKTSALNGAEVRALKFERDIARRDLAITVRAHEDAAAWKAAQIKAEAKRELAVQGIGTNEQKLAAPLRSCRLPTRSDWKRLQSIR